MPVTVLELATYRLGCEPRTSADFASVGLAMFGGCGRCHATVTARNAYPSRSGFWRCEACIGDDGWDSVDQASRHIFGPPCGRLPFSGDGGVDNGSER